MLNLLKNCSLLRTILKDLIWGGKYLGQYLFSIIYKPESAEVLITIDVETKKDFKNWMKPQEARQLAKITRRGLLKLVQLSQQYRIPLTYFITGSCLENTSEFQKIFFKIQKKTSWSELGSHTYSHLDCSFASAQETKSDLLKLKKLFNSQGLKMTSHAFPWNRAKHLSVFKKLGIKYLRLKRGRFPSTIQHPQLIKGLYCYYQSYQGRLPHLWVLKLGLKVARKKQASFVLLLHPEDLYHSLDLHRFHQLIQYIQNHPHLKLVTLSASTKKCPLGHPEYQQAAFAIPLKISQCLYCRLKYKREPSGPPQGTSYNYSYYTRNYLWGEKFLTQLTHQQKINSILKRVQGGWVLDYGAGEGDFLKDLQKRNRFKILACEISSYAYRVLQRKKIPVCSPRDLNLPQYKKQFILITLWHVLEHIPQPVKLLKQLRENLKEEGWLLIEVPHSDSWSSRIFGTEHFSYQDSSHIHFHSRKSLQVLLNLAGFKIIKQEIVWGAFPLAYFSPAKMWLAKKIKSHTLASLFSIPLILLSLLPLKTNQEVLRIYAQKTKRL